MTDAMRTWTEEFGAHLDQLPFGEGQHASLLDGQVVVLAAGGSDWELLLVAQDGARWLRVQDVTSREAYHVGLLAAARCRWLGASAGALAHDLNNQFNAALALSATLGFAVKNESDRAAIAELEQGTKVGMRMIRSLARLLVRREAVRESCEPAEVLEDALSMVRKSLDLASIGLDVEVAEGLPQIRSIYVEAVQAVMHGVVALQAVVPKQIRCVLSCDQRAVGEGRERSCVVLKCTAKGVGAAEAEAVVAVVQGHSGKWRQVRQSPEDLESVAVCVFGQQRLGGGLHAAWDNGDLCLEYTWPRVI